MLDDKVPGTLSAAMLLALTINTQATVFENADFEGLKQQMDRSEQASAASALQDGTLHVAQWANFNNWPNWANVCINGTWRNC